MGKYNGISCWASVKEYGHLSVVGASQGLDSVAIPAAAFESLRQWVLTQSQDNRLVFQLTSRGGIESLQARNYVGMIETPQGFRVEILPKISATDESSDTARALMLKMLTTVNGIDALQAGDASLHTLKRDWLEVLIEYVLAEVSRLVRRGVCSDYVRREEQTRFLKGQLQVSKQIRRRPGTQIRFSVSYDLYHPDRPENRLIRVCLEKLCDWSRLARNQRLCLELLHAFSEIEGSTNIATDLQLWSDHREMAHYQAVHPWITLILSGETPVFSYGGWKGVSLLFPMEELFENYVAIILQRQLKRGYQLRPHARSEYLVRHRGSGCFQLKPDMLIQSDRRSIAVLDTKWKLLHEAAGDRSQKYRIQQSDLYQLFAYGEKYLNGSGDVFLIYPAHEGFSQPLPAFHFHDSLRLWIVPFDISTDELVTGDWIQQASWLKAADRRAA